MASLSSEDDEFPDEDWIDYDRLTDECLSRTNLRRRSSTKSETTPHWRLWRIHRCVLEEKQRGRDIPNLQRLCRPMHTSGSSGPRGDSAGKHGRSDVTKKHRNAQRVFKELGTVLLLIDSGVSSREMEDASSEWTDPLGSMDDTTAERTEIDDHIEQIPVDASAEAALEDDAVDVPWDQGIKMALEEVLNQTRELHQMGQVEVPPHITELVKKGEDAKGKVILMNKETQKVCWSTALMTALADSLTAMHEIVKEMRENCNDYRSNSSWSSASSGGSLCAQKDQTLLLLLRILQELYTEVASSCVLLIQLMQAWFREEMDACRIAYTGFQLALKLTSILREVIEFELVMCDDGVGPVKVIPQENVGHRKEKQLIVALNTMNSRVVDIQESFLCEFGLESEELSTVDRKKQSLVLRRCWESMKEVTRRVASCHPSLKRELYSDLLATLTSAAYSLTNFQSTREDLAIIQQTHTVLTDQDDPPVHLTDQEIEAQVWLLPCLKALRSVSDDVAKQICKSRSFKAIESADPLLPLRRTFRELIHISIARMIRSTQPVEPFDSEEVKKRWDDGLKMLYLLSRYDKSCLSAQEEEADQYEVFEKLTNRLLNNVLSFQTGLQANDFAGRHVLVHQVSLSSSGELTALQDREPSGCLVSQPWFSEDTSGSGHIGVGHAEGQASQSAASSVGCSVVLPNPFKDAQPDSSSIQVPSNLWKSDEPNRLQEYSNPLSNGGREGLPNHPLSSLPDAYSSVGTQTDACPGVEHFYTISKNELVLQKKLGSGSTGQVFRAFYRGVPVAMKIMHYPYLLDSQQRLVHESEIHCRLAHHPNLVQFYGQCLGINDEHQAVGLVMELCTIGSLFGVIRDARHLQILESKEHEMERYTKAYGYVFLKSWILRIKVACDIAAGMEFLQSRNIVHRDLTSYNVVLSHGGQGNQWIAKICDFERSKHVPPGTTIPRSDTTANSCAWASPEVLRNGDYSTQADVFSAGVILWEILTLEVPWEESRDPYCVIRDVSDGERLSIPPPSDTSIPEHPELVSLITDAWKEDPDERPSMSEFHERILHIWEKMVTRNRCTTTAA